MDRIAPGLRQLLAYQREWLRADLVAGVSVAAVAVPTAIAYAQLIGFEPVVGLYAAILPLVAYALFGTSPQLIVNPDAATCAVFAATVLPLARSDPSTLPSLSVALSVITGLVCIAAGLLRLGFVADFLAKPILVGYLNGVAISIFLGQVGKVFGFAMSARGITLPRSFRRLTCPRSPSGCSRYWSSWPPSAGRLAPLRLCLPSLPRCWSPPAWA